MANEENDKVTLLEDEAVENAAGGWAGSDKYTQGEYCQAGVKWTHRLIGADIYINIATGEEISQAEAEKIADEYYRTHGK